MSARNSFNDEYNPEFNFSFNSGSVSLENPESDPLEQNAPWNSLSEFVSPMVSESNSFSKSVKTDDSAATWSPSGTSRLLTTRPPTRATSASTGEHSCGIMKWEHTAFMRRASACASDSGGNHLRAFSLKGGNERWVTQVENDDELMDYHITPKRSMYLLRGHSSGRSTLNPL